MKFFVLAVFLLPVSAESLRYSINWPSGLSLGEAALHSDLIRQQEGSKGPAEWDLGLDIDASIPGFAVKDRYHSTATPEFCTTAFEKSYQHGARKNEERVTIDLEKSIAIRQTLHGGGTSQVAVPDCAREALTFLQFARRELTQGRIASQQPILFGATYRIRFEYSGAGPVMVGNQRTEADHLVGTLSGPSTNLTFEIFFAHDAARTPVLAKIPLSLGTFTVELVP